MSNTKSALFKADKKCYTSANFFGRRYCKRRIMDMSIGYVCILRFTYLCVCSFAHKHKLISGSTAHDMISKFNKATVGSKVAALSRMRIQFSISFQRDLGKWRYNGPLVWRLAPYDALYKTYNELNNSRKCLPYVEWPCFLHHELIFDFNNT